MLEFKKLDQNITKQSFLFYGKSGTGKTTVAGTFPKPLFIDINERGTGSVSNKDAIVAEINSWKEWEDFLSNIDKYKTQTGFETLVIDTIGKLQDVCMEATKKNAKPQIQDWGNVSGELKNNFMYLIAHAIKNDYYIIFLAHERDNTEATEGVQEVYNPNICASAMPSVSEWLHASVTLAGHTRIFERKDQFGKHLSYHYVLKIGADSLFKTKVRLPKGKDVPSMIDDCDFNKLIALFSEKEGK